MKLRTIAVAAALTPFIVAGSALAQSSSNIGVSSNPVTASVLPGTGVALGTFTLTSPGGAFTVNSLPVNLALGGGALAGNLSNCLIYNTSGASTTQALGPAITVASSTANAFSFNTPLAVNSGSPVTLQVRCDVSAATPTSGTFQFTAGTSTAGLGTSSSGAALAVQADFVQRVPAGLSNAIIGVITLDATKSNQAVTVNTLPISVAAGNGANLSALTSCALSTTNGSVLTTGGNAVAAITGSNQFRFDTPVNIPAGEGKLVVLRCSVAPSAIVGSTLTVSVAPSSFQALAGGSPVTVTQGQLGGGSLGTNTGVVTIAAPGTPTATSSIATPGLPNTGAGGDAPYALSILVISGIIALIMAHRARSAR